MLLLLLPPSFLPPLPPSLPVSKTRGPLGELLRGSPSKSEVGWDGVDTDLLMVASGWPRL